MRLVVIASDSSGSISLASERVFADAAEATRELARLLSDGAADGSASFYTVDIDTAVPVIILQQPAPPQAATGQESIGEPLAEEPSAPSPDAQEVRTVPVVAAEPDTEPAEAREPRPGAEDGAAAQWPWDLPVIPDEGAIDEVPEESSAGEAQGGPASEDDAALDSPAAEPAEPEEPAAAEFGAVSGYEQDAQPQDLVDEPVADEPAPPRSDQPDAPAALPPETQADAAAPDAGVIVPVVVEPQSVLDAGAAPSSGEENSSRVYEPGALNMNEYTCDDCVYANTCPNHGQKRPAECGSFQWKSV